MGETHHYIIFNMCVNGVQKISMNNLKRATVPLFFATKIKPKYLKIKIQHFRFQFCYLIFSKFSLQYNENTKSTANVAFRKKNLQITTPKGEHTSERGENFFDNTLGSKRTAIAPFFDKQRSRLYQVWWYRNTW